MYLTSSPAYGTGSLDGEKSGGVFSMKWTQKTAWSLVESVFTSGCEVSILTQSWNFVRYIICTFDEDIPVAGSGEKKNKRVYESLERTRAF